MDKKELRDHFAGLAMQGMWCNTELLSALPNTLEAASIARMAYEQADAMIAEREKGVQP